MARVLSHGVIRCRVACGCVLSVALLTAPSLHAQSTYKWTDQQGVVHFADQPPPAGQPFEEVNAPPAERRQEATSSLPGTGGVSPVVEGAAAGAVGAAPPAGQPAPVAPAKAEQFSGPARVILTAQQALRRGPDVHHVVGTVKNVGAQSASGVGVTAHVLDAQGGQCLQEKIDVAPSTLEPGETGNFDTTLQSPCFFEGGNVDVEPYWE